MKRVAAVSTRTGSGGVRVGRAGGAAEFGVSSADGVVDADFGDAAEHAVRDLLAGGGVGAGDRDRFVVGAAAGHPDIQPAASTPGPTTDASVVSPWMPCTVDA